MAVCVSGTIQQKLFSVVLSLKASHAYLQRGEIRLLRSIPPWNRIQHPHFVFHERLAGPMAGADSQFGHPPCAYASYTS